MLSRTEQGGQLNPDVTKNEKLQIKVETTGHTIFSMKELALTLD